MNESGVSTRLPKYKCHKEVWALKIREVEVTNRKLVFDFPFAPKVLSDAIFGKHDWTPGGYWVRYEDGYESYSPAEAFENGYTLIAR